MEPPPKGQAKASSDPTALERVGKYALLSVIGKGSMGVVYKTFDPDIKRPVALKTIRRDLLQDDTENFSARFRHEAQAAGALLHPGIVAVYEYGEEGAYAYIAMEYVEGRSLRECFEQKMVFTLTQVVGTVSQLLEALQYAHERGVWHRDIKPANILVMSDGRVKVTDFGIARIESSMLTQVGAIMGTPGFIAPEMYLGSDFDSRIDVFAAGVVAYQLLAGTTPFVGTPEKVMFKVCYETPLPPSVAARLPALQPYDAVVMRALARRPEDRFASAALFREALLQAQARIGAPGDSDATIIPRRTPPAGSSRPGTRESTTQPPSTDTLTGAGWNMEDLNRLEKRLARFVGPIARVMVRRAAKETHDLVSLTQWLGAKIGTTAEREEFLRGAGVAPTPAPSPRAASERESGVRSSTAPPGAARPLTAEDIDRAGQLLAARLGPIARVLVKRAGKPGSSREEFIATLAGYLSDDAERMRFLGELE
jgi:eukaryotic-like serine/threonine-protein kinase